MTTQAEPKLPKKRWWWPANVLAWLWLACFVFSLGFFPLRASHDEWWHLKTGKYIVEHDYQLPENDVFTYTAKDYEWHNHEWLSQVLMYQVWQWGENRGWGGWRTLIFFKSLLLVVVYLLLARFLCQRAGGGWKGLAIGFFLAVLAAAVGRRMFWPRPPTLTNIFFVFFLYVLWLHRTRRIPTWSLIVLPLLMPLWANLHGGFLLGGIAVAAYFAGEVIAWCRAKWISKDLEMERGAVQRGLIYLATGILCGIGSLVNPYTWHVYFLSGRVMKSTDLVETLSELLPPDFRFTWAYLFLIIIVAVGLLIVSISAILRYRNKKPFALPPAADLLLVVFLFQQSISHVRHLILFGFVAAPLAAWLLARLWDWLDSRGARMVYGSACAALGVWIGLWVVFLPGEAWHVFQGREGHSQFQRNQWLASGLETEPFSYPVQAVEFILKAKPPGRMYNRNNFSGYLIWKLSPEHYKLFTDSRFDIFGQDFLADEMSVAEGGTPEHIEHYYEVHPDPMPGMRPWREVVDEYDINWIIVHRDENVNWPLLHPHMGWTLIYSDSLYRIYIRRAPGNQPWIERYERPARTARLREEFRRDKESPGYELPDYGNAQ
ncbi:MAG: hypothetical protein ACOCVL_00320 [Candidatus Sumerlaeota bacterium]